MKKDLKQKPIIITDTATDRYATFGFISWWDQRKVRDAYVMVVGAGALGNEILKNLALMGVGHIFIVDFDTIEDANLSRSILFRPGDNGRKKAEVAAERVREINPDVLVDYFHGDVNYGLGLGVFRRMDVIIGGLDNGEARLSINQACWKVGVPWIDGAIQELFGVVKVFVPPDSACYECTLSDVDFQNMSIRYSCPLLARQNILVGKVPTTPTISSIIAGMQTQEALKIIHGMEVSAGSGIIFNGLINDFYITRYPKNEKCQSHYTFKSIEEIKAKAEKNTALDILKKVKEQLGENTQLHLDQDIVTSLNCPTCNSEEEVLKPLNQVTFEEGNCPKCGEQRQVNMTHKINMNDKIANKKLIELGVPPFHVLTVTNGETTKFLELNGDLDNSFFID